MFWSWSPPGTATAGGNDLLASLRIVIASQHFGPAMGAHLDEGSEKEWRDILKSLGWESTEERLHDLCKFLESEGLTWRTVGLLGDPSEWAPQFTAEEVRGVMTLGKGGRKRPRLVCNL